MWTKAKSFFIATYFISFAAKFMIAVYFQTNAFYSGVNQIVATGCEDTAGGGPAGTCVSTSPVADDNLVCTPYILKLEK